MTQNDHRPFGRVTDMNGDIPRNPQQSPKEYKMSRIRIRVKALIAAVLISVVALGVAAPAASAASDSKQSAILKKAILKKAIL